MRSRDSRPILSIARFAGLVAALSWAVASLAQVPAGSRAVIQRSDDLLREQRFGATYTDLRNEGQSLAALLEQMKPELSRHSHGAQASQQFAATSAAVKKLIGSLAFVDKLQTSYSLATVRFQTESGTGSSQLTPVQKQQARTSMIAMQQLEKKCGAAYGQIPPLVKSLRSSQNSLNPSDPRVQEADQRLDRMSELLKTTQGQLTELQTAARQAEGVLAELSSTRGGRTRGTALANKADTRKASPKAASTEAKAAGELPAVLPTPPPTMALPQEPVVETVGVPAAEESVTPPAERKSSPLLLIGILVLVAGVGAMTWVLTRYRLRVPPPAEAVVTPPAEAPRPPSAGPMAMLQRGGRQLLISSTETTVIGRAAGPNSVQLDDVGVSARHATLEHVNGQWLLRDLQSTNGTFVNEQRVSVAEVHDGDRIRCGGVELVFRPLAPRTGGQ
ncbi:MAG: FHA domain-containing protein [Armatimonadia bacterium]